MPFLQGGDFVRPPAEGPGERAGLFELLTELEDGLIRISRQFFEGPSRNRIPLVAVPAEQDCVTGHQVADGGNIKEAPGAGAESGDALGLQGFQIMAAVLLADAVQQEGHLAVILNYLIIFQKLHQIGESFGLVPGVGSPYADDGRVVGAVSVRIGDYGFVVAEGFAVRVGPVRRGHPIVVAFHYGGMRAVVGNQLDDPAVGHPLGELQDVAYRGPPEAVYALVLVTHHAQVLVGPRQFEEQLFLYVVGVLVFVH